MPESAAHAAVALAATAVGVGWRQPHFAALLETRPRLDFIEVHSENFFAAGGATRATLRAGRDLYPISVHGVGLALGSVAEPRPEHVEKLACLVGDFTPALVSEHLCWSRAAGWCSTDLLPLPLSLAALDLMSRRVDALQRRLRRTISIENISAYLQPARATFTEPEFLNRLAARTGCGVLLDINNLHVNACNFGTDPIDYIDAIAKDAVTQYHLAGHTCIDDCVVDTHGAPIAPAVWALYRHALARIGARPTLIERDTEIPPLPALLEEAAATRALVQAVADASG
jgi:uncharacterized protein